MYASADREAARIRGAHLSEVSGLTPHAMAANVCSAAMVLWTFGDNRPIGLWVWWGVLMLISGLALLGWLKHRTGFAEASPELLRQIDLDRA